MKFTKLENGVFAGTGEAAAIRVVDGIPVRTVQEHLDLQVAEGFTAVLGHPDQDINMPNEVIRISVGGTFDVDAPDGSILWVGEETVTMNGPEPVTIETDGEYEIRVHPPFPYKPWKSKVIVE